jgi:hypothetical protein
MNIINKSLSTDFNGNILIRQFHDEIEANATITTELFGIEKTGDEIDIRFANILSGVESTALDGLIESHIPDMAPKRITHMKVYPFPRNSTGTNYHVVGTFFYNGSILKGNIIYIDLIGYMESSLTSYDVQVIDKTNNKIIAENNFTNIEISKQSMGTISNVPTEPVIMQVLLRGNGTGNKSVTIQEIQVWIDE